MSLFKSDLLFKKDLSFIYVRKTSSLRFPWDFRVHKIFSIISEVMNNKFSLSLWSIIGKSRHVIHIDCVSGLSCESSGLYQVSCFSFGSCWNNCGLLSASGDGSILRSDTDHTMKQNNAGGAAFRSQYAKELRRRRAMSANWSYSKLRPK